MLARRVADWRRLSWLSQRGDFARAEKLALVVMQGSEVGEQPTAAWRVYAECRFRLGGFKESLDYFKQSVRKGSDDRVCAMMTISAAMLDLRGADTYLGPLSVTRKLAQKIGAEEGSLPPIFENGRGQKVLLAYCWLALAALDKGQIALDDAAQAEKALPKNVAVAWMLGIRLFELGKVKEAKAKFQIVAESDFKKMAKDAKKRVEECDAKMKDGNAQKSCV